MEHRMKPVTLSVFLLIGSLVLTTVLWMAGLPFFFVALFIPLLPFMERRSRIRRCPACGWETTGNERFCPYDATMLADAGSGNG